MRRNRLGSGLFLETSLASNAVSCVYGDDLREQHLTERKAGLRELISPAAPRILYLNHIAEQGKALYEQACERDLEGIVAKPAISPYREIGGKAPWFKIKNPDYTQSVGRAELFNTRR